MTEEALALATAEEKFTTATDSTSVSARLEDWQPISGATFKSFAQSNHSLPTLVGGLILERLPFTFDDKLQYLVWKDALARGLHVDARDIVLVGSAATGRSLNARKQFKPFDGKSDIDIAIMSGRHFDTCWEWFRTADPQILGFDEKAKRLFEQHRNQYIFDGMIAANYFLSYFDFGNRWLEELQRSEALLPSMLQGRAQRLRIYRDSHSLRRAQLTSLVSYRSYLGKADATGELV